MAKPFNSVAFDCIWLHSYRLRGRWGCARTLILTFSQGEKGPASVASLQPRLVSSGVVRSGKLIKPSHLVSFPLISLVDGGDAGWGWEVPVFAGTTAGFAGTTHVTNVRAGGAMAQWVVVVGVGVRLGVTPGTCCPLGAPQWRSCRLWHEGLLPNVKEVRATTTVGGLG